MLFRSKYLIKTSERLKRLLHAVVRQEQLQPFSVFAEEHERIRNIGLPKGKNWFSESAYSKKRYSPPHKSYLDYGEWEFDPLKEELIQ